MMHRLTIYVGDVVIEQAEARARDEGILRADGSGDVLTAMKGLLEAYAKDRVIVVKRSVARPVRQNAEPTGVDYVAARKEVPHV